MPPARQWPNAPTAALLALAALLPAQQASGRTRSASWTACTTWVEAGNAADPWAEKLLADHWQHLEDDGEAEELVLAVTAIAEDGRRDVEARDRALRFLRHVAPRKAKHPLGAAARERVARAMVRLTRDGDLPVHVRGPLLVFTASLDGPERLDWLLEGQVRLRNRLAPGAVPVPDADLLPYVACYLGKLGPEGAGAWSLLLAAATQDETPLELRERASAAMVDLARRMPLMTVREAFCTALATIPRLDAPPPHHHEATAALARGLFAQRFTRGDFDAACQSAVARLLQTSDAMTDGRRAVALSLIARLGVDVPQPLAAELFVELAARARRVDAPPAVFFALQRIALAKSHDVFGDTSAVRAAHKLLDDFALPAEGTHFSPRSVLVAAILEHAGPKIRAAAGDEGKVLTRCCDDLADRLSESRYAAFRDAAAGWRRSERTAAGTSKK